MLGVYLFRHRGDGPGMLRRPMPTKTTHPTTLADWAAVAREALPRCHTQAIMDLAARLHARHAGAAVQVVDGEIQVVQAHDAALAHNAWERIHA